MALFETQQDLLTQRRITRKDRRAGVSFGEISYRRPCIGFSAEVGYDPEGKALPMLFDVFFSICQTPVDGVQPTEKQMFAHFFDQVQLADELGYEVAWVAESHLSCEVQKHNPGAVIPNFKGEIGLNTDILLLAPHIFARTRRIAIGAAIKSLLCNGGPIAHAESVKSFLTLHQFCEDADRKLHLGVAAGRFPFSSAPYGIMPRDAVEKPHGLH